MLLRRALTQSELLYPTARDVISETVIPLEIAK
jgi:hypothetical protein